jgi:hypothetical protein
MAVVCLAGPSAAVPTVAAGGAEPMFADLTVTVLTYVALVAGGAGTGAGLLAVARGWRPRPWTLFAGGLLAAVVLTVAPVAGSTDALDYAVYGRIVAIGHDPWVLTPGWLFGKADPVGLLAPPLWRHTTAAYGPVAVGVFALASLAGGASMAATVSIIKVVSGLSFLLAAYALDRAAGPGAGRRVRVHLLWTLNPLMLWSMVVGAHVDVIAAALTVAAILALRRPGAPRGAAAGALLAAAVAVKAPFALAAVGLAWAMRRSPRTLVGGLVAGGSVIVPAYLLAGSPALRAVTDKGASRAVTNPWRPLYEVLHTTSRVTTSFEALTLLAGLAIAALTCWSFAPGADFDPAVVPAFALCLGWLVTSPMQHPWYDALLFPLLALLPRTPLDALIVTRFTVDCFAYVPGVRSPLRPAWLETAVHQTYDARLAPLLLDVIMVAVVLTLVLSRRPHRLQDALPA